VTPPVLWSKTAFNSRGTRQEKLRRTWNRIIVNHFTVLRFFCAWLQKKTKKINCQLRRAVPGPRFKPKHSRTRCSGAIYLGCFSVELPRQNSRDADLERHNLGMSRRALGWQRDVNRQIEVSYSSRHCRSYIRSLLWEL
jgi:hypothetical protein